MTPKPLTIPQENDLDNLVTKLYERIAEESDNYIRQQLKELGVDPEDKPDLEKNLLRQDFPGHPSKICRYYYKGRMILAVNKLETTYCNSVEYITPKMIMGRTV